MKKSLIVLLILSSFLLSCSGSSWQAHPLLENKHGLCDQSIADDMQMIFIPGYGESVVLVEDCDYYRAEKIAIALQNFELAWISFFGNEEIVFRNLRSLVVHFGFEKRLRPGYTADGSFAKNGIIEGMTTSRNSIWVHTSPGNLRICDTSLVHELVHASLWAKQGHGDPDHLGSKFSGWRSEHFILIDTVNRYLCILGI